VNATANRLEGGERSLLCVGPVWELGYPVQEACQHRNRRLVVLERRRVLVAADSNPPQRSREELSAHRPGPPGMEVEVVPVRAQHTPERVCRVADVDLNPFEVSLEKRPEQIGTAQLNAELRPLLSGRELEVDHPLAGAAHHVVIVISSEEHEAFALQSRTQQCEQALCGAERVTL